MIQQSGKSPYQADVHWASFKNVGGDDIPAYAVVAPDATDEGAPKPWVDGDTGQIYYRLRLPTGGSVDTDPFSTNYDLFAINGPTDVPAGDNKFGACTFARHAPTWVLLDPEWSFNDDRFDVTFEVGPVPGETYMSDAGSGFRLLHRKRLNPEADSPLIGLVVEKATGGLSIVRFSYSATNGIASAICEIKARPVGASVPDTILEGSAIIVHDPSGCYFNAPGEELTGRHGWAAYMQGDLMPDQLYEAPHWEVFAMCCDDSECYE